MRGDPATKPVLETRLAFYIAVLIVKLTKSNITDKTINFTDYPIQSTQASENEIYPPYPIHKSANFSVNEEIISQIPMVKSLKKGNPEEGKKNTLNMSEKPVASKVDKVPNILHCIKRFYSSYYRGVTKSKQNLYAYLTYISIVIYICQDRLKIY